MAGYPHRTPLNGWREKTSPGEIPLTSPWRQDLRGGPPGVAPLGPKEISPPGEKFKKGLYFNWETRGKGKELEMGNKRALIPY